MEKLRLQCPKCMRYNTIPEELYQNILNEVLSHSNLDEPKFLETAGIILEKQGITFRPIATIKLILRIMDDAKKKLEERRR